MGHRNGEEEGEGRPCEVCGEVPENIIFLSCAHTVCLLCMGRVVFEAGLGVEDPVACPLCAQPTALSPELQEALAELVASERSEGDSLPETSALHPHPHSAPASARGEQLRLPCLLHAEEEAVYYRPADHGLLCAQCALGESGQPAATAGLRPLRRCLPQVLDCLRDSFRQIELEAKRLALLCAESDFRREAVVAAAGARQRRFEEALDELAGAIASLKSASARDFRARIDTELRRLAAAEGPLRQRRDFFREASKQSEALRESAGSEKLSAAFALAEHLRQRLAEPAPPSNELLAEQSGAELAAWAAETAARAQHTLTAKLSLALGDPDPPASPLTRPQSYVAQPYEVGMTTAFHFRPSPNRLLARLQERARGNDPGAERSPLKLLSAANSTASLSTRLPSALKPRALAYSALKRRELEAKLQAARPRVQGAAFTL